MVSFPGRISIEEGFSVRYERNIFLVIAFSVDFWHRAALTSLVSRIPPIFVFCSSICIFGVAFFIFLGFRWGWHFPGGALLPCAYYRAKQLRRGPPPFLPLSF